VFCWRIFSRFVTLPASRHSGENQMVLKGFLQRVFDKSNKLVEQTDALITQSAAAELSDERASLATKWLDIKADAGYYVMQSAITVRHAAYKVAEKTNTQLDTSKAKRFFWF
jgi:hypothetical protein